MVAFLVISQPNVGGFCLNMDHFKACQGVFLRDPETAVSVLASRPGPRSEPRTLDRLDGSRVASQCFHF